MNNNSTVLCLKAVLKTFSLVISLCIKCRRNCFFSSNATHFLRVYLRNKPTQDVGRIQEKLLNHEPEAFPVFSKHPKRVYYPRKPIQNAFIKKIFL